MYRYMYMLCLNTTLGTVTYKWNNSYLKCGWVRNRSSNMNYSIYTSCHFTPHGRYDLNKIDLAPNVWLHSSVGRASHQYRGGPGFESRWSLDFFQASSFQLLKLEIYCDDHSLLSLGTVLKFLCFIVIYHHGAERSTTQNEGKNKPQRVHNTYNLKSLPLPVR